MREKDADLVILANNRPCVTFCGILNRLCASCRCGGATSTPGATRRPEQGQRPGTRPRALLNY